MKTNIGIEIKGDIKEYVNKLLREHAESNKMTASKVKYHFKKFFGYELPQTQINVFSPEFIEFCLYISAQQSFAVDGFDSEPKCMCPADGLWAGCPVHGTRRR